MGEERYPADLAISLADFLASGWKQALGKEPREGYSAMWGAFAAAAHSPNERLPKTHIKVLWLLADACSMILSPSSPNEPFKPYQVFHDRRSVGPDDLSDADILFFAEIVDVVDDDWLKARLSDLIWLRCKPRNTVFALKAIDAYQCLSLDADTWSYDGQDCWQRAISLAKMLKGKAGNRLKQMETTIVAALNGATRASGFLGLWLADLLMSNGLGRAHTADVARKLEALAHEFDGEGPLHMAREYFSAAAIWYKTIPDEDKSTEMTVVVAEGWVKEAIARTASESPSHMIAASFYENAIQIYRTLPRAARATHRVDERIVELRAHLNDAGERSLGEMRLIQTPGGDITPIIESARRFVTEKSAQEALLAFANLYPGVNAEELRSSALEGMRQYPLRSRIASIMMSRRDGRVIAKRPAMSSGGELTEDDEIAIRAEMIRNYGILVSVVVRGCIWPALEILLIEHRLREADFVDLACQSSIVPKERSRIFGKALFAGYELDFVSALHLLIPQIEHLVRVHLKQAMANTANLGKDGIQHENGMSTLMDLPETEQVFGKDLAFELKSLFCDAFGPNLRNELAHGLLDEDQCYSPFAIYAWWLALRLTFKAWWNAADR